jgi:FAD/FMN-containing dehydrogenase
MKKAYLKELSRQLLGDATDSPEALEYFSTDLSIFQITPTAVVYPGNTADVRKTVEFVAGRAAAGKSLSLTPRGHGTDMGGAALGEGIVLVLPAHMDKLLRLDRDTVTVQPGISFQTLQQTLHTHGRFLPPYSAELKSATVGGAVASDASSEKSVKYGSMRDFVRRLKVVLSDGSVVETRRLSARELNRKKGLSTLEGELYRKVDSLILDHPEVKGKNMPKTVRNSAGYRLDLVRGKDGSFDLGQVIIGSQGTLGVITEISLRTALYNPRTTLLVGCFDTIAGAGEAVVKLRALGPSMLEMVDYYLLESLRTTQPSSVEGLAPEALPMVLLLVEFDDFSQVAQKLKSNRARRVMGRHGATVRVVTDPVEQVTLSKVRWSEATAPWAGAGAKKALPFIEDGVVPPECLPQLLDKTYKLLRKHELDLAVWGHAGDGNLHLLPLLDVSRKKDVDKLFSLSREFSQMLGSMGGTTSGGHGDGLVRALSLETLYGEEMMELFASLKHIFDPLDIFNPMQKTQATEEYARAHLRGGYSIKHSDHLFYT